jgi:hypothetical protein
MAFAQFSAEQLLPPVGDMGVNAQASRVTKLKSQVALGQPDEEGFPHVGRLNW